MCLDMFNIFACTAWSLSSDWPACAWLSMTSNAIGCLNSTVCGGVIRCAYVRFKLSRGYRSNSSPTPRCVPGLIAKNCVSICGWGQLQK